MANENVTNVTSNEPEATPPEPNQDIDAETYQQMLDILKDLTNHTHIFYDDYTTACNCNCNCFGKNTRVITDKGIFAISDLVGTETLVQCIDGEWRPATWKNYGVQKLFNLTFENGLTIEVTSNHRWIVLGKEGYTYTIDLVGCNIPVINSEKDTLKVISVTPAIDEYGIQKSEEVFCCEEPETETFALENGIITMNCTCCVRGMVW